MNIELDHLLTAMGEREVQNIVLFRTGSAMLVTRGRSHYCPTVANALQCLGMQTAEPLPAAQEPAGQDNSTQGTE